MGNEIEQEYEQIKKDMSKGEVHYTLDQDGHMTNIAFKRHGYFSYVDVIQKRGAYAIVFYGDYEPFVIQGNWWNVTLEEFNPRNFGYVMEKIGTDNCEEFDYEKFRRDAREGILELQFDDKDLEAQAFEITDSLEYEFERHEICDRLIEALHDPDIVEVFWDWGMRPTAHFLCWMAIVDLAQEKMREDEKNGA